ncbi:MAG: M48 family metallopeptidase [candidate division Zixibacteria bacterium]|nr:M48 family metallopeptidase [candidate division Zixibacteria bacterium]
MSYLIGRAYWPESGGDFAIAVAVVIWLILSVTGYFSGKSILLAASNARQVQRHIHPQLFNVVEEMKIAANLPVMPKIYVINDEAPNAFATGIKPEDSAIAVTAGLLSKLNRDELQGVIAHEMSHIVNRDILFMTFAGVTLGSIVLISRVFLRGFWYTGSSRGRFRSKSSDSSGRAQLILWAVAIVFAILAPIAAYLFYFAISRKREYLADATAVRLTRYPEGLASALEKISLSDMTLPSANKVTAPMYIVNPLRSGTDKLFAMTSTHPLVDDRIKVLRKISGGAGYSNYEDAFLKVKGAKSGLIPKSGLNQSTKSPIREARTGFVPNESTKRKKRDIDDLRRAIEDYTFFICACGLRIKIPPELKENPGTCPRCHNKIEFPIVEMAAVTGMLTTLGGDDNNSETSINKSKPPKQVSYRRKSDGWESFSCSCGALLQLSPLFNGKYLKCNSCGNKIEILGS